MTELLLFQVENPNANKTCRTCAHRQRWCNGPVRVGQYCELNKAFKKGQESSHEDYIRGYTNGYKDAEKQYNESVAYHFPIMPTTPSGLGCDGTHCTNPHMDCINCPRKTTGGVITTPNTASVTSTATLHGNTSATDGKDHNPSFTD